ncbi:hypothetical protein WBJ53_16905 [Spirosoma sp. SC4-14]|uniref:hypothetical protein n=1 Tax=Spirosoma sp. SC4-14 TaxID=3128900 RepID=UPI0030D39E58
MFRNKPGDKEKTTEILIWILKNQHQDPNAKIYGIWKTSIAEDKVDQNRREFIDCDLSVICKIISYLLPQSIIGLMHAAKGP